MNILEILQAGPVMPVIVIDDVSRAVPLAAALVAGGIRVLEVTLRTPAALAAITAIARDVPEAIVGAGTVLNMRDLQSARDAGARFGVSPGTSTELLHIAQIARWPFLPGVMTPSDVITAVNSSHTALKLFPAAQAGGIGMLKALGGPFPQAVFCPTGGINRNTAADYLALPNVACVGGSWLAPADLVAARNWNAITELAQQAASLHAA